MSDLISDQKLIDIPSKRRAFLRRSVAMAAGGAAMAVASGPTLAGAPETVQQAPENSPRKGYRVTQHVLDYYKTAAF